MVTCQETVYVVNWCALGRGHPWRSGLEKSGAETKLASSSALAAADAGDKEAGGGRLEGAVTLLLCSHIYLLDKMALSLEIASVALMI